MRKLGQFKAVHLPRQRSRSVIDRVWCALGTVAGTAPSSTLSAKIGREQAEREGTLRAARK
jgi:hypothetical protein